LRFRFSRKVHTVVAVPVLEEGLAQQLLLSGRLLSGPLDILPAVRLEARRARQ